MGADIAAAVATTKERLAQGGASARGADRPATATIEGGLACRVDGPDGWSVSTDMPAAVGGNADAPSPGWLLLLYIASASLWLAVVRRSTAALIFSASFSVSVFLVSSRAASISLASASPTLARCSFSVFSTL